MASVVKRLRPRIVVPICMGSNPIRRPIFKISTFGCFFVRNDKGFRVRPLIFKLSVRFCVKIPAISLLMSFTRVRCKKTHGLISLDRWCDYFGQVLTIFTSIIFFKLYFKIIYYDTLGPPYFLYNAITSSVKVLPSNKSANVSATNSKGDSCA